MKTVENFDEYAEGKRQPFYKDFHKVKVVSYILMALSLAFVVALFVLVFAIKEDSLKWIIYVDLGLCFACLVTLFIQKFPLAKVKNVLKNMFLTFYMNYKMLAIKIQLLKMQPLMEKVK